MLIKGHYFPGQKRTERVILFIRRHWATYVPWISLILLLALLPWIIMGIFGAIGISISDLLTSAQVNPEESTVNYGVIILLSIYYLFLAAYFLKMWIDNYLDIIIVTPGHLANIQQIGLLSHKVSEQSLLRVQDVTARVSGFWQTFFRYGTVIAETAGDEPNFMMKNVSNPNSVASMVLKLHDELVESGGLEEELSEGVGMSRPKSVAQKRKGMINKVVYNLPANRGLGAQKAEKIEKNTLPSTSPGSKTPVAIEDSRVVVIQNPVPGQKTAKKSKKVEKISTPIKKSEDFNIESSWLTDSPENQKAKATGKKIFEKSKNKDTKIKEGELQEGEEIRL